MINPNSPAALVEVKLIFYIPKGGIISKGTIGLDDHAKITAAIKDAVSIACPEGMVMFGCEVAIKDY